MADYENGVAAWLPSDSDLVPFYKGVDKFVEQYLILPASSPPSEEAKEKSILDPEIGYVHLNPWEMLLLDTKLFQRLKKITQLGLAFQVFPALGYSRFEHTLGVLGRLTQVLNKLRETHRRVSSEATVETVILEHEEAIRLAIIFHDVGHCIFSHVSERAISELPGSGTYPSAKRIVAAFADHFQLELRVTFAEILSLVILGTQRVYTFINGLGIDAKPARVRKWLKEAGRFIMGLPVEGKPDTVFLGQLMNSGFDVDKLDYMTREGRFSRIPLGIDLERILDKLRVFRIGVGELPLGLAHLKDLFKAEAFLNVLGFARGGQFAFEEFCLARVALYDKIYLHQKIRAAEAQLVNYLRRLPKQIPQYSEAHRWLYLRESYLEHPNATVPTLPEPDLLSPERPTFAGFGLDRIDDRDLLHRAFAFGPANSLSDPLPGGETMAGEPPAPPSLTAIESIERAPSDFVQEVAHEVAHICRILSIDSPKDLGSELVVELPRYANVQQGVDTLYFEKPTRLPLRWTMPIDRIVDYYKRNRALAFVFSPRDPCHLVLLGAEKVIERRSKGIFLQDDIISRHVLDKATDLRVTLSARGYYSDAPALKPMSEYLMSAKAQEVILSVCSELVDFQSFVGQRVAISDLTAFLMQFPNELQEAMLRLLGHIEMVHVRHLWDALNMAFRTPPVLAAKRPALAPLGSVSDSATHLLYKLRGIAAEARKREIPDADILSTDLVLTADHIVFFDDNINSGKQVLNIFAQWLGEPLKENLDLKEEHVQPLGGEARGRLRAIPISLVFPVGTEGAAESVRSMLVRELGFDREKIDVRIQRELKNSERLLTGQESKFDHDKKGDLRDFLRRVGESLMLAEGKPPEVADARALGYGGAEALVVFPYNVPTMTITALWCRGKIGDGQWVPLVERKRRTKIDGSFVSEDA